MVVQYDPHALDRMRQRRIGREQVEQVLASPQARYPAEERARLTYRATIYHSEVDGRRLRVYVLDGSDPPYVLTAAWSDEEG